MGDGIRYGAESLVAFLERYGHLRFGLGLVEVAIYRLPSGERLLQPRVLAKTEILQKTVLVGPSGPVSLQAAAQAEDAETPNSSQREWFVSFWGEFLAKLKLDDESLLPAEPARSTNQFFQMPPGGGMTWISAYIAQSTGRGGVYLTFAKAYERAAEIADLLEADRESIERELGASLTWERLKDKIYIGAPNVVFKDLNNETDRRRVVEYLAQMTARMIRVFKPRLEAATRTAN